MKETTVLITGGGPAGSAAAIRLGQEGIDCILLEKAVLPKEKLCGGLYTQKTHNALKHLMTPADYGQYLKDVTVNVAHQIEFYKKTRHLVTIDDEFPMTLVDRGKMDQWLFNYANKHCHNAFDGAELTTIDFENRIATLRSGEQIRYHYLIAADGAFSHTEQLLHKHDAGFPLKGDNVVCAAITVDKEDYPDIDPDKLRIYFDIVPSGYSGMFSFGDKVRFGIAKYQTEKFNLKKRLIEFSRELGIKNLDKYPVRGAQCPYGNIMRKPIWRNHVFFCGDAAGFVEPMSAEGICYALRSGTEIAESIIETCKPGVAPTVADDVRVSEVYQEKVDKMLKLIDSSKLLGKLYDNWLFKQIFYLTASKKAKSMGYFYSHKVELGDETPYWKLRREYHKKMKAPLPTSPEGEK